MVCLYQLEVFTFTAAFWKYSATLSQLYEINDTMQDQLAQFLGHDIRVYKEYYHWNNLEGKICKVFDRWQRGGKARL